MSGAPNNVTNVTVETAQKKAPSFLRQMRGLALRHYYLLRNSPPRLMNDAAWAALDVLIWGFIGIYLNQQNVEHANLMVVAAIAYQFFFRVQMNSMQSFLEDIWARSLLHVYMAPMSFNAYVLALMIMGLVRTLPGIIFAAIVGIFAFDADVLAVGWYLPVLLLQMIVAAWGFGLALVYFVFRYGHAGEWLIWPLGSILFPLTCVFYPLSIMPELLKPICLLMPATVSFELMRSVTADQPFDWLFYSFGMGVALVWLGIGYLAIHAGRRYLEHTGGIIVMGE